MGTQGDLFVESAYTWQGEIKHYLTIEGQTQERNFPRHDQLAAEFTYFSDCILSDQEPEPNGIEGLIDVRIIQALYQSISTGQPVKIPTLERDQRPTSDQSIKRPPVEEKPDLIHAASPGGH